MKQEEKNSRNWHTLDAKDKVLGRLATEAANHLRGKDKPSFVYNQDLGDYVVIINADKVALSGKKADQKMYYKHTGYIGNLKTTSFKELKEKNPELIVKKAVAGMLPKNKLRDEMLKRLKIYTGGKHPHQNVTFVNAE